MKALLFGGVLAALMVALFLAGRNPAIEVSEEVGTQEVESEIEVRPESSNLKAITLRQFLNDLKAGKTPEITDDELWSWIDRNGGSEEAWLHALSSRFSYDLNNQWLAKGLEVHPKSLPLTFVAANAELLSTFSSPATSRKWLDRFVEIDTNNGLAWLMSAFAEYLRGNTSLGDEHLIRAGEQNNFRVYSTRFENASYDFYMAKGYPDVVATLMGGAASPTVSLPRINDIFRDVLSRSERLRESRLSNQADALVIAGYKNGINIFETDIADTSYLVYPLVGSFLHGLFKDHVPLEIVLENSAAEERIQEFLETNRSVQGSWPEPLEMSIEDLASWAYAKRQFGELEAAVMFAE